MNIAFHNVIPYICDISLNRIMKQIICPDYMMTSFDKAQIKASCTAK